MLKIFAATIKELILLKRDRTGLLILFLMPALLVIVITLVQENVMEITGQKKTQIIFLDLDEGVLGRLLRKQLIDTNLEIITWDSLQKSSTDLQQVIASGEYQAGIVIEEGSSKSFQNNAAPMFQTSNHRENNGNVQPVPVSLLFDPGVMPGFRSGLMAQIRVALISIAMKTKMENLGRELSAMGIPDEYASLSAAGLTKLLEQPLLTLQDNQIGETLPYNPVHQNVPAWAIFGMFFTAIPIAGTILQERKSGIWVRLTSLPVSHLQLFSGKVLAYLGVCLCQFLVIGLIGFFVFPHIGLPAFTICQNLPGVILTVFFISLAACGFGILLGIISTSYEQASALGATFVVCFAAIGGVMVPVYAMPELMQRISIVSPLNWGLTAFQDLLVRGHSFSTIVDDLRRLTLFFLASIIFAWKLSRSRK